MPGEDEGECDAEKKDVPCDEEGGIGDCIGTDADVALFDELGGLVGCGWVAERGGEGCVRR